MIAIYSSIIVINAAFYHLALWLKNVTEQTSFLQIYMIFNSPINNPKTDNVKKTCIYTKMEQLYRKKNASVTEKRCGLQLLNGNEIIELNVME